MDAAAPPLSAPRRTFFLESASASGPASAVVIIDKDGSERRYPLSSTSAPSSTAASTTTTTNPEVPETALYSPIPPSNLQLAGDRLTKLVSSVRDSVIGDGAVIQGPYGPRRMTYLDYTASGRSLSFIEDYIRDEVLPVYGNTHSSGSQCGFQSTLFREEARTIIKDCVRGSDKDVLMFCGSGATGGAVKLVHILGIAEKAAKAKASVGSFGPSASLPCSYPGCGRTFGTTPELKLHQQTHLDGHFEQGKTEPDAATNTATTTTTTAAASASSSSGSNVPDLSALPVVFVGPYAHHSNILPWREAGATVEMVPEDVKAGGVDMVALKRLLDEYRDRVTKVGAFTAASNITGVTVDVDTITMLLHRHGALAVWDYAAAAPHAPIDMNPALPGVPRVDGVSPAAKDAVFFSPHKFVGGPGTPGVLVMKKSIMTNPTPSAPGGGTVFFVHHDGSPLYLQNEAEREEGGTPDIVGAVRAGLVFHLQRSIGPTNVLAMESAMADEARALWSEHPRIRVLGGSPTQSRVAIVSFVITHGDQLLHWSFVTQLLNDLFGIQCRGGCLCAGPYALELLGIDPTLARKLEHQLLRKDEMLRPGFVRVSFPYHMSRPEFEFVVKAVQWVADHGHTMMSEYTPFAHSGEWRHRAYGLRARPRQWLQTVSFVTGEMQYPKRVKEVTPGEVPVDYDACLAAADAALDSVSGDSGKTFGFLRARGAPPAADSLLSRLGDPLRWFAMQEDSDTSTGGGVSLATTLQALGSTAEGEETDSATVPDPAAAGDEAVEEVKDKDDDGGDDDGSIGEDIEDTFFSMMMAGPDDRDDGGDGAGEVESKSASTTTTTATATTTASAPPVPPSSAAAGVKFPLPATSSVPITPVDVDTVTRECAMTGLAEFSIAINRTLASSATLQPCKPNPRVLKLLKKAVSQFNMIRDHDRLLLGLSGGKDSMSLLHHLLALKRAGYIKFEIGACTIDPQAAGFDPAPLRDYLARLGVPYFFESQPVIKRAETHMNKDSICAWCARMKRGILYTTCRREGYNVLVLGQHLDDLAESLIMSAFYNGKIRTMGAHYVNDDGDLRIIRPLAFVRERDLRTFASDTNLPIIDDNCPACFTAPTERYRTKTLLASQEHLIPALFSSLKRAMMPLLQEGVPDFPDQPRWFDKVKQEQAAKQTEPKASAGVGAGDTETKA